MNKRHHAKPSTLPRVLSLFGSVLMVIGIMIGTGIFKKVSPMAALGLNEGWIIAAWVVAGIVTVFGAVTIFGLASLTDQSGGEYEYLRIIFGDFIGFIFGWSCFTIIGSASVAAMSYLFTQSLSAIVPFSIFKSDVGVKIVACLLIVCLTLLNCLGTKKSIFLNNLLTVLKVGGLLSIIVAAFYFHSSIKNFEKFTHFQTGNVSLTHFMGIFFTAMLSAFWAYDGWLSVAFMSGEIKNPQKIVPVSIITGILLVMGIYVLVNMAFLTVMPLKDIASIGDNSIAADVVALSLFGPKGHIFISILVLVSSLGSLNGIIITYSRMYYKMSLDGYFFKKASSIHARFGTPHVALLMAMIISVALVFSGTFDTLTNMIVFAGFLFYLLLAYGLMVMKKKKVITTSIIGYPVIPMLFILFSVALVINCFITDFYQTICGVGLMLSGIPLYFYFTMKRK